MKILLFILGFKWCGFGHQGEENWDIYIHRLNNNLRIELHGWRIIKKDIWEDFMRNR